MLLPFEVTGVILLVAAVGAIVLAKPDKPAGQEPARRAATQEAGAKTSLQKEEENMVPVEYYLALSAILFVLGIWGCCCAATRWSCLCRWN